MKRVASGMPTTVKVGPFDYSVGYMSELESLKEEMRGECNTRNLTIRLSPDMPHQRAAETLLHEVLHAIWDAGSMDCVAPCEENFVTAFGSGLYQVMRDNPELVDWLAGEE